MVKPAAKPFDNPFEPFERSERWISQYIYNEGKNRHLQYGIPDIATDITPKENYAIPPEGTSAGIAALVTMGYIMASRISKEIAEKGMYDFHGKEKGKDMDNFHGKGKGKGKEKCKEDIPSTSFSEQDPELTNVGLSLLLTPTDLNPRPGTAISKRILDHHTGKLVTPPAEALVSENAMQSHLIDTPQSCPHSPQSLASSSDIVTSSCKYETSVLSESLVKNFISLNVSLTDQTTSIDECDVKTPKLAQEYFIHAADPVPNDKVCVEEQEQDLFMECDNSDTDVDNVED